MRIDLKPKSLFFPEPVIIIGTYDENGIPNAMNAAWGGISDTNEIGICISNNHKTTENILKNRCFTIFSGTIDTVIACDYVGMVSGNDEPDKLLKTGWHVSKAEHVNAPIFEELPFAIECELISYDEKSGHLFGKMVSISADESIMTDGVIDIRKLKPIIFNGADHSYMNIGDKVGDAFADYKKIK